MGVGTVGTDRTDCLKKQAPQQRGDCRGASYIKPPCEECLTNFVCNLSLVTAQRYRIILNMEKEITIKIFKELLGELRLNPNQLSESIGKSRPQWAYDVLNEGKKVGISKNIAELICKKYPQINKSYLLTGEGSLTVNESTAVEVPLENEGTFYTENHNGTKFYELPDGNYRMEVSLVPWCAYGRFANECGTLDPDKEEWEKESFHTDKIVHGRYLAFEVRGDSMDDGTRASFEEGDIVLVRELDRIHWKDGIRFKDHPYWVVVFDSSVLIKQMVEQDLEGGKITFHSLNPSPEYADFTLNMDDIRALYSVLQKKPKTVKF